ncbi:alpha/beta hydrolase [Chryseobacterium scophthalmum]|uniref:Acetyl esterase/lipase n=1 Tax=Chryseobacterium scophthalmum TaxID=59733 RepID=A0A1N6G326_9FLAO|nr:alpha/beta hydrolase [Chryseobacterium scophthalmum]SIO01897.1 Acetyl esterase/lipase [Chryseobacterium scophthalmum]
MRAFHSNTKNDRFLKNLFFLFLLTISTFGFSQKQKSILLFEHANVSENIVYKTDETNKDIKLDIYRPKNTENKKLPVVMYVHGGAWVEGDKIITADNYVENTILKLLEKNYVVISINYRLVTENIHFPAPIQDTKDAVRWVRKNADKYNLDENNIGMWGVSAGAHLSLLSAYTQDEDFVGDKELSKYSAKVNYVVDNFGPTDMNRLLHTRAPKPLLLTVGLISKKIIDLRGKLIMGITGLNSKEDKKEIVEFCKTISPLHYTQNTVPTLILHGNKDKIAPIRHSKRLNKMLKKQKTTHELIIVKKGNHGFSTTEKAYQEELNNAMVDFILSQEKANFVNH